MSAITGTRRYWIKPIGTRSDELPDAWLDGREELKTRTLFPVRPSICVGDRLAYCTVGSRKVCAIAEVLAGPFLDKHEAVDVPAADRRRWRYSVEVRLLDYIDKLPQCPKMESLGLRQPLRIHAQVSEELFAKIAAAVRAARSR